MCFNPSYEATSRYWRKEHKGSTVCCTHEWFFIVSLIKGLSWKLPAPLDFLSIETIINYLEVVQGCLELRGTTKGGLSFLSRIFRFASHLGSVHCAIPRQLSTSTEKATTKTERQPTTETTAKINKNHEVVSIGCIGWMRELKLKRTPIRRPVLSLPNIGQDVYDVSINPCSKAM